MFQFYVAITRVANGCNNRSDELNCPGIHRIFFSVSGFNLAGGKWRLLAIADHDRTNSVIITLSVPDYDVRACVGNNALNGRDGPSQAAGSVVTLPIYIKPA
jgi:hypothetical protein